MRGVLIVLVLIMGFLFFGSILVLDDGFGIYLKRSPSFNDIFVDAGEPPYDLERLIVMTNHRYSLLLLSYSERGGLNAFRSLPALP